MSDPAIKIVVLDGKPWLSDSLKKSLEAHGEVTIYPFTNRSQVFECIQDATIVVTNKAPIDAEILGKLTGANSPLKLIVVAATGYNNIDIDGCKALGIAVCNCRDYATGAVAEWAVAMLTLCANPVQHYGQIVAQEGWGVSNDPELEGRQLWCGLNPSRYPRPGLEGKTLGIIGGGAIGRRIDEITSVLGMGVWFAKLPGREYDKSDKSRESLENIFANSDYIIVACPLTDSTHRLVSAKLLGLCTKVPVIINVSRGQIVNVEDLANAYLVGQISAYMADVSEAEPPNVTDLLIEFARTRRFTAQEHAGQIRWSGCLVTPHIAFCSEAALVTLNEQVGDRVDAFLQGQPFDLVSA